MFSLIRIFASGMRGRAVYVLLLTVLVLACCTTPGRYKAMRNGLDSLNDCNRNYLPFTAADVQPYVYYFDDHGTANDRLLAHYLLGRAYYDAGEAPMALKCYQDALDCVDTTDVDIEYAQLSRVYAQMAEIFYRQDLHRQELKYGKLAEEYAWKGHDTLVALINREMEYLAYNGLGLIDSAIFVVEDVAPKYEQLGYRSDAAVALGAIVRTLVDRGELQKAKHYMDMYESKSGLFSASGDIAHGREIYYKSKGLYYLYNNVLDSAEYFFRKELRDGKDFNNQNAAAMGLAMLFQKQHQADSAAKYAIYAYAMNDSMYAKQATETVERMQSMYNYSRHQEEARQEREKASNRLIYIWITIAVILFLTVILAIIFIILLRVRQKRKAVEAEYEQSLKTIEQAHKDLERLQEYKDENKKLIAEKEALIHEQDTIRKLILKKQKNVQEVAQQQFKSTDIYQKFSKLSDNGKQPSTAEWTMLQDAIFYAYPNFSELMTANCQQLDDREYKTCILIRADFKPNAISCMLGVLPSVITQIRINLLLKLFTKHGTSKEFDVLIKRIY